MVLSTDEARFIVSDIENFYLGTLLDRPEFMRLPHTIIPQEIKDKYNFAELEEDVCFYTDITRGMYGLTQTGLLANTFLTKRLEAHGYYECQFTAGLW